MRYNIYKILLALFIWGASNTVVAQELSDNEKEEIINLYTAHYAEWITSKDILELQKKWPELESIIKDVPIQQTEAFKEALKESQSGIPLTEYLEEMGDEGFKLTAELIKSVLDPNNSEVVSRMYWKIINSAESKEIAEMVLYHMEKTIDELKGILERDLPRTHD